MEQKYGDHTITLTANMRFQVAGPLYGTEYRGYTVFDTYREATEAIDKREKAQEKQERTKLSIKVLDGKGREVTITGVHGRNYNLLGVGDAEEVYPAEAWISDLIRERIKCTARATELRDILNRYKVVAKPYGLSRYSFEDALKQILNEIDSAAKMAVENRPAKAAA